MTKKKPRLSQNSKDLGSSRAKHLNREWLHQKYIIEGLSSYVIAAIVKRNPKNVYDKLRAFNIPTRSRAETLQKNAWWKNGFRARSGFKHSRETKEKIRSAAIGRKGLIGAANPMFGKKGELSPNWKGGTTPERQKLYRTPEWRALVNYVFARDEYTCLRCKSGHDRTNKLHTHHVRSWSAYPDLRSSPDNLITVCNHCHRWIHSSANTKKEFIA